MRFLQWGFRTFHQIKKSARLGPHSGSELSADFSSSSPPPELSCPPACGTFCAVSQKCTRTLLGSDTGYGCFRGLKQLLGETEPGSIVTSVYGGFQKYFVLIGYSLRGSHLESGTLFPLRFVSDSHAPCVLVLPVEYRIGYFGRS